MSFQIIVDGDTIYGCHCGEDHYEWGIVNGVCRCIKCHREYTIKDSDGKVLQEPKALTHEVFETAYRKYRKRTQNPKPIDEVPDEEWVKYGIDLGLLEEGDQTAERENHADDLE